MSEQESKFREITINYWSGGEWKVRTYRIMLPVPRIGDEVELWTEPFGPPTESERIGIFTVTHRLHMSVGQFEDYSTGITLWLEQDPDMPQPDRAV